jgi:hypothetical protein
VVHGSNDDSSVCVGDARQRRLVLAALLIAIAVAIVVIVGSQRRLPPPFGLKPGSCIVYNWAGHLFVVNVDGTGRRQLVRAEHGLSRNMVPRWNLDRLPVLRH